MAKREDLHMRAVEIPAAIKLGRKDPLPVTDLGSSNKYPEVLILVLGGV